MLRSSSFRAGRWVATLVVLMAVTACDNPFGLRQSEGVSADARNQQVVVTNNSASPVFTIMLGRMASAYTDWVPCVDVVRCPPLQPGGTIATAYSKLILDPREIEVVVFWWHADPNAPGPLKVDRIRSIVVPLL